MATNRYGTIMNFVAPNRTSSSLNLSWPRASDRIRQTEPSERELGTFESSSEEPTPRTSVYAFFELDDHVPYNEEVLLKSAENYAVVGRLFIRLKYIMGKLHIGGLMRFGQRIDLTNHELDISKIKLTEIPVSPILSNSMMRSGVGGQGQP